MKEKKYKQLFENKENKALKRAWINRDFEIEMYWKRASYFWTFIAATFVGYITLITSNGYNENLKSMFPQIEYLIICLGLVFSIAWVLVNIGSKRWQKNWENHIDILEDNITGPIYKVVSKDVSYSVSKINLLISGFVSIIWLILAIRYSLINLRITCKSNYRIDWIWIILTILTIIIILVLIGGYGRTSNIKKKINFLKREIEIVESN